MNCKIWRSMLYVAIAGVIIEAIQLFAYYFVFPRFDMNHLIEVTVIIGTLVAGVAVCGKNKSPWYSLLRWLMLMISCFLALLFTAYTGIARFLLAMYDGEVGEGTQNAIGLQSLLTSIAIFGNTLIIILIRDAFFRIRKAIQKTARNGG